ncbi:histidine kinase [bacterium SCSIO 12643]|nr:histidine kinase [bacterium SCSIO 12643]
MSKWFQRYKKEILYWSVLIILLFLFVGYDKKHPQIRWSDLAFILNYFGASLIVNYVLIPRFLYQKKYTQFWIYALLILINVAVVEEFVLEQIFYPDTRAQYFNAFLTFVDVTPPMMLFVGFKFALDAFDKQSRIEKLHRIATENELQFLTAQINPHFLFNNLNNIYAHALENSPETPQIVLQLSTILRYMLYDCRQDFVFLKDESSHLEEFINLYRIQHKDARIDFKSENVLSHQKIAPLILIVFVENAFKHSFSSQTDSIQININLRTENGTLFFDCENTYDEVSNTDNLSKGIGLKNVRSRLNLVYPDRHQLQIDQDENRYHVSLQIQITE